MATLSVRLDSETFSLLQRLCARTGKTKSELVREAVVRYDRAGANGPTPYELMKPYLGSVKGGPRDLSERTGEKFAQMLREERNESGSNRRRPARRAG